MDFFSRQDDARARSQAFFVAFALALCLAVIILYFVVTGCFLTLVSHPRMPLISGSVSDLPRFIYGYPPRVFSLRPFLIIGTVVSLIILAVSITKTMAIKNGGAAYIIEAIGGELVDNPREAREIQLINVVEEMAVAAGLPRPRVYILPGDTRSINAITAGLDYDDAVIAVTEGAVTHLSRDELQGVVAHEFAHILNGDYSLNLIMAGWLYGLMFFYLQGLKLAKTMWRGIEAAFQGGSLRGIWPLSVLGLVVGLILMTGGWVGQALAELVQAAFSRQREYLADAFAVQFTRNPAGLAGAMKKIAWLPRRGRLRSGEALLMRAFFIVSPAKVDGLFQTHPPLEDRIRALEPAWDGAPTAIDHPDFHLPKDLDKKYASSGLDHPQAAAKGWRRLQEAAGGLGGRSGAVVLGLLAAGGAASAGGGLKPPSPSEPGGPSSLSAAQHLYEEIPLKLRMAVNNPKQVLALTASVLLGADPELKTVQLNLVKRVFGPEVSALAAEFKADLSDDHRLTLLGLAAPTLKALAEETRGRLVKAVKALIAADGKLDLFEIAACQMLKKPLGQPIFATPQVDRGNLGGYLETMQADVVSLISILARLGADSEEEARAAFAAGLAQFNQWPPLEMAPKAAGGSRELIQVLDRLAGASDKIRNNLLLAAVATALHQPKINAREYELLRALAAALDIPLPLSP